MGQGDKCIASSVQGATNQFSVLGHCFSPQVPPGSCSCSNPAKIGPNVTITRIKCVCSKFMLKHIFKLDHNS